MRAHTLVIAATARSARARAEEAGLRPSEYLYVSSPTVLRGLSTGGMRRLYADDWPHHPAWVAIAEMLVLTDHFTPRH